ncbi:MAG: phosphatidylinositol kinase, partial [Actinobacteria bacterium]|nr:phosphatidylinositol kinase [Actinomycetota bacterium]
KLRTVLWQWEQLALLESELAMLETLDAKLDGQVGEKIKELITTEEFKALRKRVSRLQMMKVFPSPSPDWPAVPWPPF